MSYLARLSGDRSEQSESAFPYDSWKAHPALGVPIATERPQISGNYRKCVPFDRANGSKFVDYNIAVSNLVKYRQDAETFTLYSSCVLHIELVQ